MTIRSKQGFYLEVEGTEDNYDRTAEICPVELTMASERIVLLPDEEMDLEEKIMEEAIRIVTDMIRSSPGVISWWNYSEAESGAQACDIEVGVIWPDKYELARKNEG